MKILINDKELLICFDKLEKRLQRKATLPLKVARKKYFYCVLYLSLIIILLQVGMQYVEKK